MIYGFLGAGIVAIAGYLTGVLLFVLVLSSAGFAVSSSNNTITTMLINFLAGAGNLPLVFAFGGATVGFAGGFLYSHEKDSVPVKPS